MAIVGTPVFNQRNGAGTQVTATKTFTAGSYGLVICFVDANGPGDTSITFTENVGEAITFNEIATADRYNATDAYAQEAAWFQFTAGGAITVTATQGASGPWAGIVLIEDDGTGFDTSSYLRTTATPNCGALSNTNANATRYAIGLAWGGGTLANVSGYTDGGAGADYGGTNTTRVSYFNETSVNSRTSQFGAGTGVSPFHCTQFIFNEDAGGGGGGARRRPGIRRAGYLGQSSLKAA
jgi:hypothetical protein